MSKKTYPLVSTAWVAENLKREDLIILDGSFFLPNQGRNARAEYEQAHIPGAQFFDIDAVADPSSNLPHMLPSPEDFAQAVERLGIANDSLVVVYDSNYFMASARVWWTFRVFGHDRVAVLDGGIARWKKEGRAVESGSVEKPRQNFTAQFKPELVRSFEQVKALLADPATQILDARRPGRFHAIEPEPRAGVRGGHIPGSRNLPCKTLSDDNEFVLKSLSELEALYQQTGFDLHKPTVTTCGTGVTASILALGLYLLGNESVAVYDGSWTEWGAKADAPVEVS